MISEVKINKTRQERGWGEILLLQGEMFCWDLDFNWLCAFEAAP